MAKGVAIILNENFKNPTDFRVAYMSLIEINVLLNQTSRATIRNYHKWDGLKQ